MPNPFLPVPQPPTPHDVYLTPQRDNAGHISWMWAYKGDTGNGSNFPTIMTNPGTNTIQFTILDDTAQPITFAQGNDAKGQPKAIWLSQENTSTAKHPGFHANKNYDFQAPDIGLSTIKLTDLNRQKADFVYQLNFEVPGHKEITVPPIDPIVTNGDGGSGLYASATLLIAAGIAAVLAVAFVRFALGWRAR